MYPHLETFPPRPCTLILLITCWLPYLYLGTMLIPTYITLLTLSVAGILPSCMSWNLCCCFCHSVVFSPQTILKTIAVRSREEEAPRVKSVLAGTVLWDYNWINFFAASFRVSFWQTAILFSHVGVLLKSSHFPSLENCFCKSMAQTKCFRKLKTKDLEYFD